ncbi:MAG: hypothetical protein ABSF32_01875 [Ignavibacteria bacterium]|jgi:hypothetical protein
MPCEAERNLVSSLESELHSLQDDLHHGHGSKTALLAEIRRVQSELANAKKALENCLKSPHPPQPQKSTLKTNERLNGGEYIVSPSARYYLIMQHDGNLVLYEGSGPSDSHSVYWSTGRIFTEGDSYAIMQNDGDFATFILESGWSHPAFTWDIGVHEATSDYFVAIHDDGTFGVYRGTDINDFSNCLWINRKYRLESVNRLAAGEYLVSCNGKYCLVMQEDANLVIYRGELPSPDNGAVWCTYSNQPTSYTPQQPQSTPCEAERNLVNSIESELHSLQDDLQHGHGSKTALLAEIRRVQSDLSNAKKALEHCLNTTPTPAPIPLHYYAIMQGDGNFVIYREEDGAPIWDTHVAPGEGDYFAILNTLGNFVIGKSGAGTIWDAQIVVTAFIPSVHGWPFDNPWGYCGGWCWTALDRFFKDIPIARDTPLPSNGDPLLSEIWSRQCDSIGTPLNPLGVPTPLLDGVWSKIYEWHNLRPDQGSWWNPEHSVGWATVQEWNNVIRPTLDGGSPITIVLISGEGGTDWNIDHQVIAIGYHPIPKSDQRYKILVCDPNAPNNNNVSITVSFADVENIDAELITATIVDGIYTTQKEKIRGFFGNPITSD